MVGFRLFSGRQISLNESLQPTLLLTSEEWNASLDASGILTGWTGYRNREGRMGLDPLDTDYEMAHMAGIFLKRLSSGTIYNGMGIHPKIFLIVGIALVKSFPSSSAVCPFIFIGLLAAQVMALRNKAVSSNKETNEEEFDPESPDEDEAENNDLLMRKIRI
jgi:hypothetical protein